MYWKYYFVHYYYYLSTILEYYGRPDVTLE